jgi:hypothetical protein
MKIVISKSRDGNGYYTKVQNDYNGKHTEKYLPIYLPKGTDVDYGLYEVDGFLSTYEKKDGTVDFKLVVTDITQIQQKEKNPYENLNVKTESEIGTQIQITPEDLPF